MDEDLQAQRGGAPWCWRNLAPVAMFWSSCLVYAYRGLMFLFCLVSVLALVDLVLVKLVTPVLYRMLPFLKAEVKLFFFLNNRVMVWNSTHKNEIATALKLNVHSWPLHYGFWELEKTKGMVILLSVTSRNSNIITCQYPTKQSGDFPHSIPICR